MDFNIIEGSVNVMDSTGVIITNDECMTTLTKDDRKIFKGQSFRREVFANLNVGYPRRFITITPANSVTDSTTNITIYTQVHLRVKISSTAEVDYRVYNAPTYSNVGTPMVAASKNAHYQVIGAPAATFLLYDTPTTSSLGTLIREQRWGFGSKSGGSSDPGEFTIASPAQTLLYQLDSMANGNSVTIEWHWQEWHRIDPLTF
jgi:hypothetical protein